MKLHWFELILLKAFFSGVTELVVLLPKKNGKTTLFAVLALYHLLMIPSAECVIGAASEEQATVLYRQASMLAIRSGLHVRRIEDGSRYATYEGVYEVRPGKGLREIRFETGRVRVLPHDVRSSDGVIPTLALVDELHRHPTGEMYGVFRDGLGPRHGQQITISTAGASMDTPLGALRVKAHQLPGFSRDEQTKMNHVASPDGSFEFFEWCLSPEDDPHDMKTVKVVNPAPWHTIQTLSQRHDSPSTTPWQWLRFACGVWTEGEEPWIDPPQWDVLLGDFEIAEREDVWAGVDVGSRGEESAVTIVAKRPKGVIVKSFILDAGVELGDLEDTVRRVAGDYVVKACAYDPYAFRRSAEMLEKDDGLLMIEFPQSAERMSKASNTLHRLIQRREISHDGDVRLRAHVLSGIVKENERGWRFSKDPRTRRPVAALMALAMAVQLAYDQPAQEVLVAWA